MTKHGLAVAVAAMVITGGRAQAQTSTSAKKVDIVSVTGCLREQGAGNWMLVSATEPVLSNANAPAKNEMPSTLVAGKHQFKLIGVGEFKLPTYKDRTVVVKALHIKAAPVDRLNITSMVEAFPSCAPEAGG